MQFTVEDGPLEALDFPTGHITPEARELLKARGMEEAVLNPTQFLIQKLTQVDRLFRDLALNPA